MSKKGNKKDIKNDKEKEEAKVENKKNRGESGRKSNKKKIKKEKDYFGMRIGNAIIESVRDKEINGRMYKLIKAMDGTTFVISPEDFEKQVGK